MESLRRLANELSIPERTLRRAANEGLILGERVSPRRFRTTLREEMYLRSHWALLKRLRSALRTEPNVRLALLFGSLATGSDREHSDLDLLVVLTDESVRRIADLAERLSSRTGRNVQPVRLADAERSPSLMFDVLSQGRVLVDRGGRWSDLQMQAERWRRLADRRERSGIETMDDLLPDREASS